MKKIILLSSFLAALPFQVFSQEKNSPLRMIATDFCPFNCESGQPLGYVVEIVKRLFETPAVPVTVAYSSWTAAVDRTRSGSYSVALTPAHSEAPDFIFPSEPIGVQRFCFFRRNDTAWTYAGPDSLKMHKIALLRDASMAELNDWIKAPENAPLLDFVNLANGTETNFKKLAAGRVTLVIEDEAVGGFFLKNNPQPVAKAGCLAGERIYFGISPTLGDQGRAMAAKFDAGIEAMRASGELKVILDKYGLADWKQ